MPDATLAPPADRSSFEALSEIAATVNSLREPGALLETVLEIAMEALDAERGFVFLEDDAAEAGFAVRAHHNFAEDELDGLTRGSASVVRTVLQTGRIFGSPLAPAQRA